MSDQEMNEINLNLYGNKLLKADKYPHTGIRLPKNMPGGTKTLPNFPGGVGMKKPKKTKFDSGGVKGGKVINETKIVDIPTPDTSSFVSRRLTLGGPASALKKAIGVFPFVGTPLKKGKKG